MPRQLMKRWISDPQCSNEFKDYLDKFCVKYSVLEDGAPQEPKPDEEKPELPDKSLEELLQGWLLNVNGPSIL